AQVCGTHAGEERLPRETGRGRAGSGGTGVAAWLPPGDHGPGNAAHDGIRTDDTIAAKPSDTAYPRDGGDFARRREASRPRLEGRSFGILDQTGAGRSVAGGSGATDGQGGGTSGCAGRVSEYGEQPAQEVSRTRRGRLHVHAARPGDDFQFG